MSCIVKNYELVFWDFDGVIKDSVEVKTKAFANMFKAYGPVIQEQVINHHLTNRGVSRYVKFELYYRDYIGKPLSSEELEKKCSDFSDIVLKKVIESDWIDGVEEYIRKNKYQQVFVLVTGTPQNEIEYILDELKILKCFKSIWGSPNEKSIVISNIIDESSKKEKAVMIGDSDTDFKAALQNNISFILRKTKENSNLQMMENIFCIDNFL